MVITASDMYVTRVFCTARPREVRKFLADNVLSLENKHRCIKKLTSMKPLEPQAEKADKLKNAAVLVPLCINQGELSLLYTVRSLHLKVNKGQVAFPGGMVEQSDEDLESTALRETAEEIGINVQDVDVWCRGPTIGRPGVLISPVLGYIGNVDLPTLKLNTDEVESVFCLPLEQICLKRNFRVTQFRSEIYNTNYYKLPVFLGGPERVWGLTALITHLVMASLVPDEYKHKIRHVISLTLS